MNSETGELALAISRGVDSSRVSPPDEVIERAASLAKEDCLGRSLALLDEALRDSPGNGELIYARALTLLDWGRLNDALAGLRAAKDAGLSSFGLHVNLSQACHSAGLTAEAEQHALRAIALDDGKAEGHLCLAVVLQADKRFDEAIVRYERGYALAPERVDCLWEIVSCLLDRDDAPGGEVVARRAISVHGDDLPRSWALLASALALQFRWDEAMKAFERAEAIEVQNDLRTDTLQMHGFQLLWSGRLETAIELYRRYLPTSTDPGAHAHLGLVLLTAGFLRDGWPLYEFRWAYDRLLATRPRLGRPEWHGQELIGKKLLLWAEQGVGDVVQFARVARLFKQKGATVLLHVPDRLKEFAKHLRDVDRVVCQPEEISEGFDYHLSLMSASGALGIDLDSIPADIPYLALDDDLKRRWRERLTYPGFLRVGLAWAGNPSHEHDRFRSIPLARLVSLFGVEGVRFYSLQKEGRPEDAGALPSGATLIDLAPELGDFRDTAAAIDALDLIIAVDTAVVHIAGALGKPAWVMLQTPPDYRWLMEGDDSPWYPTLRLFRQQRSGEWDDVIARVRDALTRVATEWCGTEAALLNLGPTTAQERRAPAIRPPAIDPLCGITSTRYGIVQYARREETLARALEFYGEWLQPQLDVAAVRLNPGSVVVEAGSGIGAHTVALAKLVGPTGSVFAYEPDAMRARILFQNLQMNQVRNQVSVMQRRLVGSSATVQDANTEPEATGAACDTVDDLALNRLDLLKLNDADVAGDILQGAADTLWRLRPLLLVSCDREQFDPVAERMESLGYRCWRMLTPHFVATNHNCRREDIFDGRGALALVGVPEEVEPPALLEASEEVSGGRGVPLVEADTVAATTRYSLATSLLTRGEYERGFELYESRFDAFEDRAAPARKFARSLGANRRWRGEPLARRRLVIWCEQGFGDSLMMLRYLPLLKARGAKKVLVVCERELVDLVKGLPAVGRVLSGNDSLGPDDFDLHCPAMSLPYCFGTRLDTVPRDIPYLAAPGKRVRHWQRQLSAFEGLKVGLVWAGGEMLEADARRSIPLAAFEPLFLVPGVRWVSLQKDRRLDDGAAPLIDWMPECSDFLDTASLIQGLDLVIAVDTAVAHLAGALGKRIWLLNRSESEWRWGVGASDSVWYPTMTIFNQRSADRWDETIRDVAMKLTELAHGPNS